ncbi:unnamed protein product [Lactuca saligna]|uniref:Uncharacterized protein n=1 Tax=Lactuca saligna TaxID=75948 RepID=A0AA36A1M6_LACSI|nr:unnamed protein product [Lactuca saligna]
MFDETNKEGVQDPHHDGLVITLSSSNHTLDVGATAQVTATRFRRLDEDHDRTCRIINCLQEDVTTARAEVRELMHRHAFMDQRVIEAERRADEAREKAREM